MNNGKLLLASAFVTTTLLIGIPVLKNNFESKYSVLEEKAVSNSAVKAQGAAGYGEWWFNLRKDENGQINQARMAKAIDQVAAESRMRSASAWPLTFTELGPDNVGGRTRAICIDRMDHTHMFAGGVSGGLFESHNSGSTWTHAAASDQYDVLTITTIMQGADNAWYFGTGEGIYYPYYGFGSGGFLGGGIWKSTDNGATFARLTSTGPVTPSNSSTAWASVGKLGTDPTIAGRIYAGTNAGLKISDDGGTTWTSAGTGLTGEIYDVKVGTDGSVWCTTSNTRLYKSTNGNVGSFTAIGSATGYPQSGFGRSEIAIAPSNPSYVYVYMASGAGGTYGAYMTTNGGANFTQIAAAGNLIFEPMGNQGDYDLTVAVDPFDENRIVVGGVQLWKWEMTNNNPSAPVGQWTEIAAEFSSDLTYVHSDKHMVLWDAKQQGKFYVGCDGGIFMTVDGGVSYIPMNNQYNVTQYYDVDCDYMAPSRNIAFGGCQDNGTQFIAGLGVNPMDAISVGGGDGGQVAFSFLNPNAMFGTVYYGTCERSANRGSGPNSFYNARISSLSPGAAGFAGFVTPIRLWEGLNDPNTQDSILFAATRQDQSLATGNGSTKIYTFILTPGFNGTAQAAANIIPGTMSILVGSSALTDDGAGNIVGPGLAATGNTINYASKTLNLSLLNAPTTSDVIKADYDVTYAPGSAITVYSKTNNLRFGAVTPGVGTLTSLGPNDSIYVKDVIQAKFAVGFSSAHGLFVTNKPLDFSTIPLWFKVGGVNSKPDAFNGGNVFDMKWSNDGNTLFFTSDGGGIYRISGLSFLRDTVHDDIDTGPSNPNPRCHLVCTQIGSTGNSVATQIDLDPNNQNNLIVAVSSYSTIAHAYLCTNAMTCTTQKFNMTNFTSIQGNLIEMPVYACSFDKYNPGHALLGTEFGVYSTDNVLAGSVNWTTQCSLGSFPHVPTLKIHQSRYEPWNGCANAGVFYFATHGRGLWKSEVSYQPMSVQPVIGTSPADQLPAIQVFPNPMSTEGNISFNLVKSGDAKFYIYNIQGKLVKNLIYSHMLEGPNTVNFDCSELPAGAYMLSFESNGQKGVSRFVVTK